MLSGKTTESKEAKNCNTVRSYGERNEAAILFECNTIAIVQKTDVIINP